MSFHWYIIIIYSEIIIPWVIGGLLFNNCFSRFMNAISYVLYAYITNAIY